MSCATEALGVLKITLSEHAHILARGAPLSECFSNSSPQLNNRESTWADTLKCMFWKLTPVSKPGNPTTDKLQAIAENTRINHDRLEYLQPEPALIQPARLESLPELSPRTLNMITLKLVTCNVTHDNPQTCELIHLKLELNPKR